MSTLLFDIGGTSMRMAIGSSETVEYIRKIPTPPTPEEAVAEFVAYCKDKDVTKAVGGVAGTIVDGKIKVSPHLHAWEGCNLALLLSDALSIPAHIKNDAELAGMGEAVYGAGKGYAIVAYLGIGTGIGGALIHNGMVAPHALGFEPGHQVLDVSTGDTFEGIVSGSGLEKRYNAAAQELPRSVYKENTPVLAAGLYNLLLAWSPDAVVLGGSLMNDENGYSVSAVIEALQEVVTALPTVPPVLKAALGDSCGLYGALAVSEMR